MRRREYLRASAAGLGLSTLSLTAATAAGRNGPPSTTASPTSSQSTLEPYARLPISNDGSVFSATEAVLTPDGQTAFVSKVAGFHAVDVSDPRNPEVVATRDGILADRGSPMRFLLDLKYNRGRLLVASDGGPVTGFALFDVTDPTRPQRVRHYETTYGIHNCDLHGDHAYLTTGAGMEVVDVAAAEPTLVGRWSLTDYDDAWRAVAPPLRNLHDLYVQAGRAYLAYWDAGTWILDVSDPTDPTHVGHATHYARADLAAVSEDDRSEFSLEPPGNDHYVQPNDDGTLLAVGTESWDFEGDDEPPEEDTGGPGGIALWDVAEPASPTKLSTIDPPSVADGESTPGDAGEYNTTAHNFDIAGEYLYSSWYQGGVRVHDVSDPANPLEVARWQDPERASMWTAQVAVPGEFFVGSSYSHPSETGGPGALYVFPDPTANGATVTPSGPDVAVPSPTAVRTPTPSPTGTRSPTASPTPTRSPTAAPTPTRSATPTAASIDNSETTSGDGPGFGLLATLGALGAGAWRAARGDE